MVRDTVLRHISRRRLPRAGGLIGALQIASPFIIKARGDTPAKIGFIDPLAGIDCKWNTFRTGDTTAMDTSAIVRELARRFGQWWCFVTPRPCLRAPRISAGIHGMLARHQDNATPDWPPLESSSIIVLNQILSPCPEAGR